MIGQTKEKPKIISGPYTNILALRLGIEPQQVRLRELISTDSAERARVRQIVEQSIREYLDIADEVSLPTYPVKNNLPADEGAYSGIVGELYAIYSNLVELRTKGGIIPPSATLLSAGFVPDGYEPRDDETVRDIRASIRPQTNAAQTHGVLPVIEAITSFDRFRGALQATNDSGNTHARFGFAFDDDGRLAADGTPLERVTGYLDTNPDGVAVKAILGANCGSLTGIDKAATEHPGILAFAYANRSNPRHLRDLVELSNGSSTNGDIPVEYAARIQCRHGFTSEGLCCGYEASDLGLYRELAYTRRSE